MFSNARTIPLGTLRGIRISAHWSLAAMWVLVVVVLGPTMTTLAGSPVVGYLTAFVLAVAFAASVLVHELAHAVVAQRVGVPVPRVTLWMLGGVAEIAARTPTAGSTVAVAGAGPASSLGLAVAFFSVAVGASLAGLPDIVVGALGVLAWINATLAVFNMLPGSPLDGGRVLAGIAWKITGSRARGELWAANAGTALALGLGTVGMLQLFGGAPGGLWMLFIALFVFNASRAEAAVARLEHVGRDLTVAQVTEPLGEMVLASDVTAHGLRSMGITTPVKVAGDPPRVLDPSALRSARPEATAAELSVPVEGRTVRADAPLHEAIALLQVTSSGPVLVTGADGTPVGFLSLPQVFALLRAPRAGV